MPTATLILASASPRRRELLAQHGYQFTCQPAEIIETAPEFLTPAEIVLNNARRKAQSVARLAPDSLVLGVDTVVVFGPRVFGKPATMDDALSMLRELNGREHEVYSGVWLCRAAQGPGHGFVESTQVRFHRRSLPELIAYLHRIGPLDKAGAYAAQDDRGEMIRGYEGSFTNVIGLPMERLAIELGALQTA